MPFGIPKILITNKGRQFNAGSFKQFCKQLGIEQRFASIAHAQTSGLAEVSDRTILKGLKK